jgi:hypothetical protein
MVHNPGNCRYGDLGHIGNLLDSYFSGSFHAVILFLSEKNRKLKCKKFTIAVKFSAFWKKVSLKIVENLRKNPIFLLTRKK